jgi:hypothetical protein
MSPFRGIKVKKKYSIFRIRDIDSIELETPLKAEVNKKFQHRNIKGVNQ